jgi:hypothetical protein
LQQDAARRVFREIMSHKEKGNWVSVREELGSSIRRFLSRNTGICMSERRRNMARKKVPEFKSDSVSCIESRHRMGMIATD